MDREELIEALAGLSSKPYEFVLFAFPWGERGELEAFPDGPDDWQRDVLEDLGRGVISVGEAVQLATSSGHGVGKSALVAWIIFWAISTFEDTKGVITANTENQLKTKTWAEVSKWYRLFIGRDLFKMTATALFAVDPDHERTWRIDMVPWSERNTEAFAGLHNQGKRILVIFDEGSAIPDLIYETTEGALTDEDTQIIWAIFGNPTRNKGRFRECFKGGKFAHRWISRTVDSREVRITNKEQIERWIQDYGEDHDFVRVRVRGVFPRIDAESFISLEMAREATLREVEPHPGAAVVLGVDVGRFGDDPSVIFPRKGRDARTLPMEVYFSLDTMALSTKILSAFTRHKATFLFIDEGGVGGGVVDRCRQLGLPVIGVDFGSSADGWSEEDTSGEKYANKRAEIWGSMRAWLKGAAIPEVIPGCEETLVDELTSPTFGLNVRDRIQLESKKDMRKRQIKSTNAADALATTFAYPTYMPAKEEEPMKPAVMPDYDPFDRERMYA